ncbi:monooxygenase [Streptomyces sp. NBRC 14336]|jgi:putative flavoprotein involved in K+ transport|uniref:flavin-containing monooxygenase n=1 Tax=Streptomyces sp. NBRC 14336 TaxID=3030992 RepID=UPI0024A1F7A6|nr:NAD(P)/FAD-dependent oxidoreductase [Streptomyces sp. NBRC 14336]WBO79261.1 NAD(P)/FAD-dependent oxidoreductase [Streptomyces sp. SBE_14.2]GLW50585.1 monooxygenase [Streptomyces sp. NBRC 14336]
MEHVDVAVIGGGQSGLAAAHALLREGLRPVVLEASDTPAGSWPRYYDSLTLFSPARYSSLPGMPLPGDPDRYPHRDEVAAYLAAYAARLDADIRTGRRVTAVRRASGGFEVESAGGGVLAARAVVAASGTFGNPHRPALPGLRGFTGTVLHAAEYRRPEPFAGRRVVVVGAGNSAVQIAAELAAAACVTLASRAPVRFARQRIGGRDLHFWLKRTGLDVLPLGALVSRPPVQPVIDDGHYRAALAQGAPDRRPVFTGIDGAKVCWADGTREEADVIVLATGYRPDLPYLAGLDGALDMAGRPRHRGGVSTAVPGLVFTGLEWQRSLSSNSLRGVGRDAARVARRLAAHLRSR